MQGKWIFLLPFFSGLLPSCSIANSGWGAGARSGAAKYGSVLLLLAYEYFTLWRGAILVTVQGGLVCACIRSSIFNFRCSNKCAGSLIEVQMRGLAHKLTSKINEYAVVKPPSP